MTPRRRRLQDRRRGRSRSKGRPFAIAAIVVVGVIATALFAGVFAIGKASENLPNLNDLKPVPLGQNTRIYDKNGKLLGTIAGDTNRSVVRYAQIPKSLVNATVAIEDKRFWEHDGVDWYRLLGAAVHDLTAGSAVQGGSTITMQLMKNLYGERSQRTLQEKIIEAHLALQAEKRWTKKQILERYLNGVFYGNNAIGVEAASLTFFNRHVGQLTLPQAALLAGLPQAPTSYSPFLHPAAARARRNQVLDQMADQGYITRRHAARAKRAGLGLKRGKQNPFACAHECYFFDYVRQALRDTYTEKRVEEGGFDVRTTIDPRLQRLAEEAIKKNLYLNSDPAAAIVMIDSRNGYIRAMASSQAYSSRSQFNYATDAKRQAGSTFKTFVLTTAIKRGVNPYSTYYESKPLNFYDQKWGQINVSTYSHTYGGVMSIEQATLQSDNTIYEQMTLDLDPKNVVETAYEMGVPRVRRLPPYPAVGLGGLTYGVTPLDMADAYATLSNGGVHMPPRAIVSVTKRGSGRTDNLFKGTKPERVLTDGQAYEVTRILHQNVLAGTGTRAQLPNQFVAGKTGTTDNYVDAWFVGYTPTYTTAVWMGYPNSAGVQQTMTCVHWACPVAGGTIPAQIWHDFMSEALANAPYQDYPLPSHPVQWQPFSSQYTRSATAAHAPRTSSTTTGTGTTTTKTTTRSTSTANPRTAPTAPTPARSRPRPDTPPPAAPTHTPAPAPTTVAPTPAPPPPAAPAPVTPPSPPPATPAPVAPAPAPAPAPTPTPPPG